MFCIQSKAYDEMLALAEKEFRLLKVTAEELDEAAVCMWRDPELSAARWEQHFGILRRRIMNRRSAAARIGENARIKESIRAEHERRKTAIDETIDFVTKGIGKESTP